MLGLMMAVAKAESNGKELCNDKEKGVVKRFDNGPSKNVKNKKVTSTSSPSNSLGASTDLAAILPKPGNNEAPGAFKPDASKDTSKIPAKVASSVDQSKNRKTYTCRRCGVPAKGHICPFRSSDGSTQGNNLASVTATSSKQIKMTCNHSTQQPSSQGRNNPIRTGNRNVPGSIRCTSKLDSKQGTSSILANQTLSASPTSLPATKKPRETGTGKFVASEDNASPQNVSGNQPSTPFTFEGEASLIDVSKPPLSNLNTIAKVRTPSASNGVSSMVVLPSSLGSVSAKKNTLPELKQKGKVQDQKTPQRGNFNSIAPKPNMAQRGEMATSQCASKISSMVSAPAQFTNNDRKQNRGFRKVYCCRLCGLPAKGHKCLVKDKDDSSGTGSSHKGGTKRKAKADIGGVSVPRLDQTLPREQDSLAKLNLNPHQEQIPKENTSTSGIKKRKLSETTSLETDTKNPKLVTKNTGLLDVLAAAAFMEEKKDSSLDSHQEESSPDTFSRGDVEGANDDGKHSEGHYTRSWTEVLAPLHIFQDEVHGYIQGNHGENHQLRNVVTPTDQKFLVSWAASSQKSFYDQNDVALQQGNLDDERMKLANDLRKERNEIHSYKAKIRHMKTEQFQMRDQLHTLKQEQTVYRSASRFLDMIQHFKVQNENSNETNVRAKA